MTPTLTIQLDCSERLLQVLDIIAKAMSGKETPEVKAVEEKPSPKPRSRAEKNESTPSHEEVVVEENPDETGKVEPVAEAEAEAKEMEAPAAKPKDISDMDMRDAMKECRVRVLGENINDPILKTALNNKMRAMVKNLGYDSSIDMPQEARVEFMEFLRTVTMDTNNDCTF